MYVISGISRYDFTAFLGQISITHLASMFHGYVIILNFAV